MVQNAVYGGISRDEFRNDISKLLSSMGYSIGSSESSHNGFSFIAVKPDPLGELNTLIHVSLFKKRLSKKKVNEVLALSKEKSVSKVVLISILGFSDSAIKFSEENHVTVIDKAVLDDLMSKYDIREAKKEKIFDFAFELGMTVSEAKDYFANKRGKKFLGFGVEEKVSEISGRYAPVGSFLIKRDEEVRTGLTGTPKIVEKSNMFYVNLNNNELYYISKGLGKETTIDSSNLLTRLVFLPLESLKILADIIKYGEISITDLNDRYDLFYQENMNHFILLREEGFVALTPNKRAFISNLSEPVFGNTRYNLKNFTSIDNSVSSDYPVDKLKYDPKDVLRLLEIIFAGLGEVKEVIYMPYYVCEYVDDRGMKRSKTLLASKYSV